MAKQLIKKIIPSYSLLYILINKEMFKKRNIKNTGIDLSQIKQEEQEGKPKKKVKIEKPEIANVIGGSTDWRKGEDQQAVHRQLQNLSYKKGTEVRPENILAGDDAVEHETEEAKRKYLENVEMTKKIKEGKLSTKIYRGANNYANHQLTENQLQNPSEAYKWKHGPTRPVSQKGAKNTCRFDYDPSLCKDWHDSGYCVFGNSCIYLHDRSNYKTGWQLQKDFEKAERERWKRIMNPSLAQQPDYIKDLQKYKPQQICKYCNKQLKNPVQVSCLHIFCQTCADKILETNSKCPECNKIINGIMNSVEKMLQTKKHDYQQMLKSALKSKQLSKTKKNKYKDTNSLDVFAAQ